MLIIVDENSFDIRISAGPDEVFVPEASVREIQALAKQIQTQLKTFREQHHDPLVKKLLQLVSDFNRLKDPGMRTRIENQEAANRADLLRSAQAEQLQQKIEELHQAMEQKKQDLLDKAKQEAVEAERKKSWWQRRKAKKTTSKKK